MLLQCEFAVSYVKDGRFLEPLAKMFNTTLYTGYDLLAAMATSDKFLNCMYIEFTNGGTPIEPTITPSRDRSYYEGLTGDDGYIRVPISLEPQFASTGGNYQSNKATLVGVSDPESAGGAAVSDGTSQFFTVALVHMPDIDDPTKDIVYNAAPLKYNDVFTPITKVANIQLGVKASIKFEETP